LLKKAYKYSCEDLSKKLKSNLVSGLSSDEARRKLEEFGPNELPEKRRKTIFEMFLAQFKDFLILILLAAAGISVAVGEITDAVLILIIVIINAVLSTMQESKAEKSLEMLKKLSAPTARVIRDGVVVTVASREIVPGDIVILEAGNYIPADGRLIEAVNLSVSEAALTGESEPVEKSTHVIESEDVPIGDRHNMVFSGTVVARGRGKCLVTATGINTEIGHIAQMLSEMEETETPLQRNLNKLGKQIGNIVLIICGIVFLAGLFQGNPILEMLLTAISLAVAAVPEGLPAVVTIVLALGMHNMVKRHVIIRKLQAVETLGSVNVICSDKTGTLTKNEMTVVSYYIPGKGFVEDEQLSVQGEHSQEAELLRGAAICNDAFLSIRDGERITSGDPTEIALVVAAAKHSLIKSELEKDFQRIHEIPFDSSRKMMTTVHRTKGDQKIAYTKGAPDVVLNSCSSIYLSNGLTKPMTDEERKNIEEANSAMAKKGLRVLAVAMKRELHDESEPLESDLTFVGLVGMIDPPRPEVIEALKKCHAAGIRVVMITGDHKITAESIAKEIGLAKDGHIAMTGNELIHMEVSDLMNVVEDVQVYARVSPSDKLKIVQALKEKGHIVAMTGDGVNDAPALKKADIGVAMGIVGTDVAKDASEMVLTDDNFASIVSATEEGRRIFDNIRKVVYYLLSCNISEVATIFISILFKLPLPLIPVQILWMNLVTDGLPALALGVEAAEPDIMNRPPRNPKEGIISKRVMQDIFLGGIYLTVLSMFVYIFSLLEHDSIELSRTMVFFTICTGQIFHAFNSKSLRFSLFKVGLKSNPKLLLANFVSFILLISVIYIPFLQNIFHTTSLTGIQLIVSILASVLIIPLFELTKFLRYRDR